MTTLPPINMEPDEFGGVRVRTNFPLHLTPVRFHVNKGGRVNLDSSHD